MGGDVEHPGVVPEDGLGPVAVVGVPVEDQHPFPFGGQVGRCHRHVVEEAEAHGPGRQGVVAGRPHSQEGGFPFTILSDQSLQTFKAYRAYDDFERMPLHATFLVDGSGKARWQDISYEPFTDVKFLLAESRRLLAVGKLNLAASAKKQSLSRTDRP